VAGAAGEEGTEEEETMSRARDWRRRYPPEVQKRIEAQRWRVVREAAKQWLGSPGVWRGESSREKTEGQQAEGRNRFATAIHILTFPTICKWRMESEGRQPRDLRIPIVLAPSSRFRVSQRQVGGDDEKRTSAG
jgi:hypothetical protein